ncbi:hypothetical protein DRE_02653 [Drechslerella stenobrocha 248]|uniref:Uncharacterized protein n=1 Tax=Drechslerella stenobrocha 248 TaxID=1043628 RepID=W7HX02_9PEZI|nr:hypothetical protein DRE_02653 [Drechslerella stenobrocha 248]
MDLDGEIDFGDENKENVDPIDPILSEPRDTSMVEAPSSASAGSACVFFTPISSASRKIRLEEEEEFYTSTPEASAACVAGDTSIHSPAENNTHNTDIFQESTLADDSPVFLDCSTAVDIQTPVCTYAKDGSAGSAFKLPLHLQPESSMLKPKLGLLTPSNRLSANLGDCSDTFHQASHPSVLSELRIHEQKLGQRKLPVSPPTPPTPIPQKVLHRNAKEKEMHLRNMDIRKEKRLQELKLRFPRNMYESGGKRKKHLTNLRKGSPGSYDPNENDWSEGDAMGVDEDGNEMDASFDEGNWSFDKITMRDES